MIFNGIWAELKDPHQLTSFMIFCSIITTIVTIPIIGVYSSDYTKMEFTQNPIDTSCLIYYTSNQYIEHIVKCDQQQICSSDHKYSPCIDLKNNISLNKPTLCYANAGTCCRTGYKCDYLQSSVASSKTCYNNDYSSDNVFDYVIQPGSTQHSCICKDLVTDNCCTITAISTKQTIMNIIEKKTNQLYQLYSPYYSYKITNGTEYPCQIDSGHILVDNGYYPCMNKNEQEITNQRLKQVIIASSFLGAWLILTSIVIISHGCTRNQIGEYHGIN